MFILYAYLNGVWEEVASFKDRHGYAKQMENAVGIKKKEGKTDSVRNAAVVAEGFVLGRYYYGKEYGKLVMRALRHFDEVGLSNDIQAALEELLDEGCDAFALVNAEEKISSYAQGNFSVQI